ncbi:MAG: hypothetical protein Q8R74_11560 [Methylophilus sp.]|nr:hypothetical protein [Methylophilus sp.]
MISISDEGEFLRLFKALASDIINAHIHYKMYRDLLNAGNEFPDVIAETNTFWSLTIDSHFTTSRHFLVRAYDQNKDALSLFSFLKTIEKNLPLFDKTSFIARNQENPYLEDLAKEDRIPNLKELSEDALLCSDTDHLVKALTIHRGNLIAHRNAKNTAKGKVLGEIYPLTFGDFEELLKRAILILNKYSSLFDASTYSSKIMGSDDFLYIFKCVSDRLKSLNKLYDDQLATFNQLNSTE